VFEKREHPDTLTAMYNLTLTLRGQGKLDEAATMQEEMLEKEQQILGDKHPDTLTTMRNLASLIMFLFSLLAIDKAAIDSNLPQIPVVAPVKPHLGSNEVIEICSEYLSTGAKGNYCLYCYSIEITVMEWGRPSRVMK
jgi:hypothetical protein